MAIAWTDDRQKLSDLLRVQHDALDELYSTAIGRLAVSPLTGARFIIACHCLRELLSLLPGTLGVLVPSRVDHSADAQNMLKAWAEDGLDLDADEKPDGSTLKDTYAVSAKIYGIARDVARAARRAQENARIRSALILTGQNSAVNLPAVVQFHEAAKLFMRTAHILGKQDPNTLPTHQSVEENLIVIETGLLTRLGNLADQSQGVLDLLAEANKRGADSREG